MSIHAAAVELATKVGPVMPVNGKVPCWKDWPARATRTPNGEPEWQSATGVGLVTGKRAGYFVLDVDAKAGGPEALAKLEAEHGKLPPTWTSHTGGGGAHLFFKCPDFAVKGSAGKLAKGLDVRGEGGQVVAPPSAHPSGTTYQWAAAPWDRELADAPEWLLAMLRPAAPASLPAPRLVHDSGSALRRASAYLQRIPGAISGSGGHDQAWRAALAVVRGFDLSEGDALALLSSEYNPRCSPPWSERELLHKVRSAAKDSRLASGYLLNEQRAPTSPMRPAAAPKASREPGEDADDPTPAVKPPRLSKQSAASLLAEEIPPAEWLITPWLEAGSLALIVAPPNLGKTLLAFWFAAQVAAAGKRVLIIEEEGSKRGLQKRVSRALQAVGMRGVENIDVVFKNRISLMSGADVQALARECVGYALVIVDSLARVLPGVEENDAKEMGLVVASLDLIREATKACTVSIHHSGKAKWRPGEVPSLGDGRGSGALQAGVDTVISLAPVSSREEGVVQFELHITKQRDEERVAPTLVRIQMRGPAAEVSFEEMERAADHDPLAAMKAAVLSVVPLDGEGLSAHKIETQVAGNNQRKREALAALFYDGIIVKTHLGRYVKAPSPQLARANLGDPRPPSPPPLGGEAKAKGVRSGSFYETEKGEVD